MAAPFVWTCHWCNEPIADDTGYITVDDTAALEATAAWERHEREEDEAAAARESRLAFTDMVKLRDVADKNPKIVWYPSHVACDPRRENPDYWIGVGRLRNLRDVLAVNDHLSTKRWTAHTDWPAFLLRTIGAAGDE